MDATELAKGVGHIPSGLFIIVAEGESRLMVISPAGSANFFNPLMVCFAINESRPGYDAIKSGKPFSINIVGEHDTQYMRHLSDMKNLFIKLSMRDSAITLLLSRLKSVIECEFVSSSKPGDHEIVVAR